MTQSNLLDYDEEANVFLYRGYFLRFFEEHPVLLKSFVQDSLYNSLDKKPPNIQKEIKVINEISFMMTTLIKSLIDKDYLCEKGSFILRGNISEGKYLKANSLDILFDRLPVSINLFLSSHIVHLNIVRDSSFVYSPIFKGSFGISQEGFFQHRDGLKSLEDFKGAVLQKMEESFSF